MNNGHKADDGGKLLEQYYKSLRASFLATTAHSGPKDTVGAQIARLLEEVPRSWSNAYEVEQLLVHVFDRETLRCEAARRLDEAKVVLTGFRKNYYEKVTIGPKTTEGDLRPLLLRLLDDLQWRDSKEQVRRGKVRDVVKQMHLWVAGVVLVFVAMFMLYFALELNTTSELIWGALFCISAGAVGAGFSMMTGLRAKLIKGTFDDVLTASRSLVVPSRLMIGPIAALILFFFLRADYLGGDLFPDFDQPSTGQIASLIVWALVAGFSEKFVPGILSAKASQGREQTERTWGRQRQPGGVTPPTEWPAVERTADETRPVEREGGSRVMVSSRSPVLPPGGPATTLAPPG